MKKIFYPFVFNFLCLIACSGPNQLDWSAVTTDPNISAPQNFSLSIIADDGVQTPVTETIALAEGDSLQLSWPKTKTDPVMFISNPDVISVTDAGKVTALSSGVATLTLHFGTKSTQAEFLVQKTNLSLNQISFFQTAQRTTVRSGKLFLSLQFSNGRTLTKISANQMRSIVKNICDLNLSSLNSTVASLNQNGEFQVLQPGNAEFQANCGSRVAVSRYQFTQGIVPIPPQESTDDENENPDDEPTSPIPLAQIELPAAPQDLMIGDQFSIAATLTFLDGFVTDDVRDEFADDSHQASLTWSVNPSGRATIDNGIVTILEYGNFEISVQSAGIVASQNYFAHEIPEPAQNTADYFLSSNDTITWDEGTNGGFGRASFPQILYGTPKAGGTHVLALGGGGSITIGFGDYGPVDGPGPDFTIFENPIVGAAQGNFQERAQISVSEDGNEWHSFDCDVWDDQEVYLGCAGVHVVHALADPLDPSISGGDSFDLQTLGLASVRFLKITDLNTCVEGDPSAVDDGTGVRLCGASTKQGFDFDAMAIVNGQNF